MSEHVKSDSKATMTPTAFSISDADRERLARLKKSVVSVRGKAYSSSIVRAALFAFEQQPAEIRISMIDAAEKELV